MKTTQDPVYDFDFLIIPTINASLQEGTKKEKKQVFAQNIQLPKTTCISGNFD